MLKTYGVNVLSIAKIFIGY